MNPILTPSLSGPKESGTTIRAFFAQDHREIDAVLGSLKRDLSSGAPRASLASLLSDFDARLERHIHWEEEILFPAVEEKAPMIAIGPGPVMRMEHEEIRRFKAIAAKYLREETLTEDGRRRTAELIDRLEQILSCHNLKEERVYYPLSDELLSPAEAAEVLRRVRRT